MDQNSNSVASPPKSDNRVDRKKLNGRLPSIAASKQGNSNTAAFPSAVEKAKNHDQNLESNRQNKKPLFYCRLVTTFPRASFVITLSCHLLVVCISGALIAGGFDLFPTNFETLPMELYTVPYRLRDFAWQDRDDYPNRITRTLTDSGVATRERGVFDIFSSVDLYYDTDGGNIFTKTHLQVIQSLENDLARASGYADSYCMTYNASLACEPFNSIIRFFDGTYKHIDPVFDDPSFSDIPGVLYAAINNNQTEEMFKYFLPKSYSITKTSASGSLTRSSMQIGCSVSGQTKCNIDSWNNKIQTYLADIVRPKLENFRKSTEQLDFYYHSNNLWLKDVARQAILDLMCSVGSMLFIFSFTIFHTRSLWISCWAIMSIFTSFLGTNIIYVGVFDYQYFGFLHILAIFIILGIGADDLFVFYDTWRLTAFSSYPSLAHRLSDAYSKSTLSMMITSLTTSVAFFSSAISPLLATRSFGVFSGILVIYNYLSVIIFFPTVVIMYHLKFENWMWPCLRKCVQVDVNESKITSTDKGGKDKEIPEQVTGSIQDVNNLENGQISSTDSKFTSLNNGNEITGKIKNDLVVEELNGGLIFGNIKSKNDDSITHNTKIKDQNSQQNSKDENTSQQKAQPHSTKQKLLVVFFREKYFMVVTHKVVRWITLVVFGIILSFFSYQASTLVPDNEQLKIYKDTHYYTKAAKANLYLFLESDVNNLETVYIVWGLRNKDRSNCHFSSIDCRGTQVYDSTFDPNPVANQLALINFCDTLFNLTASEAANLNIRNDENGNMEIACFTKNLDDYLRGLTVGGQDWSLPWDYAKTIAFMNAHTTLYNDSTFTTAFKDWLDIPMQYWINAGYSDTLTNDYMIFNGLFGEEKYTFSTALNTDPSIYYGNKLKYIGVQVNTTINREATGYSEGIPYEEKWENFVSTQMAKMPDGVNKAFQLTRRTWHWFYVQQALADNAVYGIVIGVCLAFPILTVATMNIIIGLLATFSICCTTVCVIGVIPLAGWKLGLLVSLNMCLLVGLAVDYVVHLAAGYHSSLHKDRLNRTRDMLEEMGMSVFSGACTTLGASIFMFLTEALFFLQFGVFLFCTIGFSLLFSLGLFTVLMGLIGPQGNEGNLKVLLLKIRDKCKKRNKISVSDANEVGAD